MQYRRFGKTGKMISNITLGGMRFIHGQREPRHEIPEETRVQCRKVVQWAFESGINHIETAWGYKKSETVYGMVLNQDLRVPRNSYLLMTKGNPLSASEMRKRVENQLKDLQTNYFDFYAWHGINNEELFKQSCSTGGPVEELHKIELKLDSFVLDDPYGSYEGFELQNDPSGINIPELLRLRKLWKCYDMKSYARYRYKIFENKGHWLPWLYAFDSNVNKIDNNKVPSGMPLKKMITETHRELYMPEYKMVKN